MGRAMADLRTGVVTTTRDPKRDQEVLAWRISHQLDVPYVPYRGSVVGARGDRDYAVVVERGGVKVMWADGSFRYHPGLAIYKVGTPQSNPFLRALAPRWGDRTLDLTLGFGRDALLVADRTEAPVVGYEVNPIIALVTALGVADIGRTRRFRRPARRLRVHRGDGLRAAGLMATRSFDLVLYDPLFPSPVKGATDMEFLHRVQAPEPFDVEQLRLASSVARRRVVIRWPAWIPVPDLPFDQRLPSIRDRFRYLALDLTRRATRRALVRR